MQFSSTCLQFGAICCNLHEGICEISHCKGLQQRRFALILCELRNTHIAIVRPPSAPQSLPKIGEVFFCTTSLKQLEPATRSSPWGGRRGNQLSQGRYGSIHNHLADESGRAREPDILCAIGSWNEIDGKGIPQSTNPDIHSSCN